MMRASLHWVLLALFVSFSACDSSSISGGETEAEAFALTALACEVEGVNAAPFTVADALAGNAGDHEAADDYTYDAASATTITLAGASASVSGSGATANGSIVTIAAPGTYVVSGTLDDGQIVVDAAEDGAVQIVLSGASITSSTDSGIRIDQADRAVLILADGTTNTVRDGATYPANAEQDAAIWSDDDLSVGGTGALVVTANFEDGLASKDGLVIRDASITITAPDEGIRGKDYLVVQSGTLDITAGGDGLKSDEDEDETLGYVLIAGGTISVDAEGDAITAETDALVAGGTLALRSGGGAGVAPGEASTKAFKAGVLIVVDDGALTIDASDDAVHSDGDVTLNGGSLDIATADDAVHAELLLTINGGAITVTQSYEGLESVLGDLIINGGRIDITATDDGMNLSGDGDDAPGVETPGDPYDMVFNGGWVTISSGNDGIDSNGSIVMTGGCLAIDGPTPGTQPEQGAIDYNGDFEITGGVLVAAGAAGRHAQAPSTSSQPTIALTFSSAQSAGTTIAVQDGADALAVTPGKSFQSLVVSAPWLTLGDDVSVYRGGTATGSSASPLADGDMLDGGSLIETVTLSSSVTAVTL